jgi:hypothetical protein
VGSWQFNKAMAWYNAYLEKGKKITTALTIFMLGMMYLNR